MSNTNEKTPFLSEYRPRPIMDKLPKSKYKRIIVTTKDISQTRIKGRKGTSINYRTPRWRICYLRGKTIHACYTSKQLKLAMAVKEFATKYPTAEIKMIMPYTPSATPYNRH